MLHCKVWSAKSVASWTVRAFPSASTVSASCATHATKIGTPGGGFEGGEGGGGLARSLEVEGGERGGDDERALVLNAAAAAADVEPLAGRGAVLAPRHRFDRLHAGAGRLGGGGDDDDHGGGLAGDAAGEDAARGGLGVLLAGVSRGVDVARGEAPAVGRARGLEGDGVGVEGPEDGAGEDALREEAVHDHAAARADADDRDAGAVARGGVARGRRRNRRARAATRSQSHRARRSARVRAKRASARGVHPGPRDRDEGHPRRHHDGGRDHDGAKDPRTRMRGAGRECALEGGGGAKILIV